MVLAQFSISTPVVVQEDCLSHSYQDVSSYPTQNFCKEIRVSHDFYAVQNTGYNERFLVLLLETVSKVQHCPRVVQKRVVSEYSSDRHVCKLAQLNLFSLANYNLFFYSNEKNLDVLLNPSQIALHVNLSHRF